jgi:hypothetical protein
MGFSWAQWLDPGFPAQDENALSELVALPLSACWRVATQICAKKSGTPIIQ